MTASQRHPKSDKGLQVITLCKEMPEALKAVGSQECVLGVCMCVCMLCVYTHMCVHACVCTWVGVGVYV